MFVHFSLDAWDTCVSDCTTLSFHGLALCSLQRTVMSAVVIKPKAKHTASVIWLHGLGDSGHGWAPACAEWAPKMPYIKWVLPNAPHQPVTLNGGMRMSSWHDIKQLETIDSESYKGLDDSQKIVESFIRSEMKEGIPSNRILVGGFSQGAAMSGITGYQFPETLAGVVALSGYLPFNGDYAKVIHKANSKTPFLGCHGTHDQVVQFKAGVKLSESLKKAGVPVTFEAYKGMQHSSCPQEMQSVAAFIAKYLPDTNVARAEFLEAARGLLQPFYRYEQPEEDINKLKVGWFSHLNAGEGLPAESYVSLVDRGKYTAGGRRISSTQTELTTTTKLVTLCQSHCSRLESLRRVTFTALPSPARHTIQCGRLPLLLLRSAERFLFLGEYDINDDITRNKRRE
eukprot:g29919.t1